MFASHIEENPYLLILSNRLTLRSKQLLALHPIKSDVTEISVDLKRYNNFIKMMTLACQRPSYEKDNGSDLDSLYQQEIAQSILKKYINKMNIYEVAPSKLSNFLSLSSKIIKKERGELSFSENRKLTKNMNFFFGESFYEINQERQSIKAFITYLKTDLTDKVYYESSLFHLLVSCFITPQVFFNKKQWKFLFQRKKSMQQIKVEMNETLQLCHQALESNAKQFHYRLQVLGLSNEASSRETSSLEKLLKDDSIQDKLLSVGLINQQDKKNIAYAWGDVLKKLNGNCQNNSIKECVNEKSDDSQLQAIEIYIEKLTGIVDAKLTEKYFGLKVSLVEGFLYHCKKNIFHSKRVQPEIYENVMLELYRDFDHFQDNLSKMPLTLREKKLLFTAYNHLVISIQKNEKALSLTHEGKHFLEIIKYFKSSLLTFYKKESAAQKEDYSSLTSSF